MRYAYLFLLIIIIGCGNAEKKKPTKNNESVLNQVPQSYEWNQPIEDLKGKRVDMFGFIWMDSISPVIKQGNYIIYERPNCYQCRSAKVQVAADLAIIDIIDTTITPTDSGSQWRLVKLTGVVQNDLVNTEKLERSVYSYPDYETSGYQEITDSLLQAKLSNDTYVYVDGILISKGQSFIEGYLPYSIISTNIKKKVSVYIKKGNGPNQITGLNGVIKDMNGYPLRAVKVRMYGSWKNFQKPEEMKEEGMIFVETIKRL